MSEEPKKPPKITSDPHQSGIPVAVIKLDSNDCLTLDIPGLGGKSGLAGVPAESVYNAKGERIRGERCHVITFFPEIRHFRVVYHCEQGTHDPATNEPQRPIVQMVHESHIKTWRPA